MPPKTFLIIGATGAAGIQVIEHALGTKHKVVLYVRNPSKLPSKIAADANVTVLTGNLEDNASFEKAFHDIDAVISLLGPSGPSASPTAPHYSSILRSMQAAGVQRLIFVSTITVSQPEDRFSISASFVLFVGKLAFPKGMKNFMDTHKSVVENGSDLDWTEVRVGMLKNEEKAGEKLNVGYLGGPGYNISILRKHIGEFMVAEAEKKGSESMWRKKSPTIWTS
ncbi:hypothetical protein B0O99DRAFT_673969 [Bisporella sp. PMI_857]|nr:hypothetical protein B0O99DRAFT_673969 [Bisporella sp. PMI_857]